RHFRAKTRNRVRELRTPPRRLAEPEGNGGRLAVRVLDTHRALLDADDAVGVIAELENVAGHALDREILVHGADEDILGLEQRLIIRVVWNRAARGDRGQTRATPSAQHAVDAVMVEQRAAPAAARGEALRQHGDDSVEVLALEIAVGPGAAHQREHLVFGDL